MVLCGDIFTTKTRERNANPKFLDVRTYDVNEVELEDAPWQLTVWDARGDKAPLSRQPSRKNSPRAPAPAPAPAPSGSLLEDRVPSRNLIGDADAPLGELEERELCRKWLPLCNETGQRLSLIHI